MKRTGREGFANDSAGPLLLSSGPYLSRIEVGIRNPEVGGSSPPGPTLNAPVAKLVHVAALEAERPTG